MDRATLQMRLAAACIVVATVGILGYISPEVPGYWALAGLLPAVLWTIAGISVGMSGRWVAWCSTWLITASVWLACAWTWAPWSVPMAATWVTATVTIVAISPLIPYTPRSGPSMVQRMLSGRALEWQQRIHRVAKIHTEVHSVTDWKSGNGYTVEGVFGPGGHTWDDLMQKTRNFGSDLRLPDGCAVEVEPGHHQAAWRILVNTKDAFNGADHPYGHSQYDKKKDILPMPDPAPGSIYDDAPIGVYANGDVCSLTELREEGVLVAGAIGSGKSALMSVLMCWHVMRVDQVTYVVDLTGGSLGLPFTQPYIDGRTSRPAVWGIADTPERVRNLLTWLRDVATDRVTYYRPQMIAADDDKIPVSRDIPAIRVVFDEPKVIWGDPQLSSLASEIIRLQETTRRAGIRLDFTSLAGTLSGIPGDLKRQVSRRIAMRVADGAEIAYVLDRSSQKGFDLQALKKRRGMGYMGAVDGPAPRLMRGWRVTPKGIYRIATQAADVGGTLDERAMALPSYAAMRDSWEWQRQPQKEPAMSSAGSNRDGLGDALRANEAVEQEKRDLIERLRTQRAEYERQASEPAALNECVGIDPVRSAITTYLEGRGETSTGDIVAHLRETGHTLTRQTMQERISALTEDGVITRTGHGRYTYP